MGGDHEWKSKEAPHRPHFMNTLNVDYLKWAPSRIVSASSKLIEMKKTKDPWEVFDFVVEAWKATNPRDYESFIIAVDTKKRTSKVTNVGRKQFRGVSVDKAGTGGTIRHRLDIPTKVIYMIRKLYPDMNLDKEFYEKWSKRFPSMVIESAV